MKKHNVSRRQLLLMLILLIGLFIGMTLVRQQQELRSKATQDLFGAIRITTDEPQSHVTCSGNTCQTDTLHVTVHGDLEALTAD